MSGDFCSCDWGTTSFRLRRVQGTDGSILAERRLPRGIRSMLETAPGASPEARARLFEAFLCEELLALHPDPADRGTAVTVVISGMASSAVGWHELPYASVPFRLDGSNAVVRRLKMAIAPRWEGVVHLVSGAASSSDIMRGEETEIVGLASVAGGITPTEEALLILPGSHSKHVRIASGAITGWTTYLTGELFDVLCHHSLLRATVTVADSGSPDHVADFTNPDSKAAFIEGVHTAKASGLAASLFKARSRAVLQGCPSASNRWFLSGLLIGAELLELRKVPAHTTLVLAAPPATGAAYETALDSLALPNPRRTLPETLVTTASVYGHRRLLESLERLGAPPGQGHG